MKQLFKYDRRFQWWTYIVSHGQLLLRSTPTDEKNTQVDILFKDVVEVNLPTSIDGIEVSIPDNAEALGHSGHKRFCVRGTDVDGSVIASAVFHIEGSGCHSDPSPLVPQFPPP